MYTEENFEDYYRALIERWCAEQNIPFRLNEWDGARENMRDDAFEWDEETETISDEPAYTDEDLINEYLYFCLYDDMTDFMEGTPFQERSLAPDDDGEGRYSMFVYRDGDDPYTFYDTDRMDKYTGTYKFDKATGHYTFTYQTKEA